MPDQQQGIEAWRELSPEALEREYSPSSCIGGNYLPFISAYSARSREARSICSDLGAVWQTIPYGPDQAQRLELCVPPPVAAPSSERPGLLVFIHGGYWQELSDADSLFPAIGCVQNGVGFAAINYTLAPSASVAEIIAECRLAMSWLFLNAESLGLDAHRIVLAGSSAGAHLAAMVALPGGPKVQNDHPTALRAAVLVSGVYALEPLVGTSVNAALGLTVLTARRDSPALSSLAGSPETLVCWGANETSEFKRQSRSFATSLTAQGVHCDAFETEGRNHFDVIMDLADPGTELGRKTLALLRSAQQ